MMRVTDPFVLATGLRNYQGILGEEFNPFVWLDGDNIALQAGESFGLFQHDSPGVYTGHYFFSSEDRGRKAKALGERMLGVAFDEYGAEVIRGMTPLENKPARWMARQLGFKSYGAIIPRDTPCELFILSKAEFKDNHNG